MAEATPSSLAVKCDSCWEELCGSAFRHEGYDVCSACASTTHRCLNRFGNRSEDVSKDSDLEADEQNELHDELQSVAISPEEY
eukprot:638189-Karenia_brevis.AAC.1